MSLRGDASVDFCRSCVSPTPIPWQDPPAAEPSTPQLIDDLYLALRTSGYGQLRRIGVDFHCGCAILRGRVPTYFLKQVAQNVVLSFPGVQQLENQIEVVCTH